MKIRAKRNHERVNREKSKDTNVYLLFEISP